MRLIDELNELHAHYARMIDEAVAADDLPRAGTFAQAYEDEAVQLMAEREGLTHLLPLPRFGTHESALRSRVRRLVHRAA
ncbi:hypothetical protein NOCA170154 [metagenome]|uniref:Uncharacterized protein n=1 Tax=metagenome TaxID=256318 RepID=A0A2P2CJQ3_9ZZZZ